MKKKRRTGVEIDFFGQPAATALGPAVISLRTSSPVGPVFIVRQGDDTHTIYIELPLEYRVTGDRKEDERTLTAAYTKVIERYVRTYPEQWSWINNPWGRKGADPKTGSEQIISSAPCLFHREGAESFQDYCRNFYCLST